MIGAGLLRRVLAVTRVLIWRRAAFRARYLAESSLGAIQQPLTASGY